LELPSDFRAVEELTREAFWPHSEHSCNEHLLVHKLRSLPAFIPELDYVAEINGKLAGNIVYSKAKIVTPDAREVEVIAFGPLSVAPEFQNQGVGKALLAHTIAEAKSLGYRGILLFGHPDYYPRAGFRRGWEFGILTADDRDKFDPLMAMPLFDGAFDGLSGGRFVEDSVFETLTDEELAEFEKSLAYKTPVEPVSVDVLLARLLPSAITALEPFKLKTLNDVRRISERALSQLPGVDRGAVETVRSVMREHGRLWGAA
jgi:predicted N-acetyltransferase YhbS